jgi:probable phosphoglycerate mutase
VKLVIIRHAQSEWNPIGRYQGHLDPDLTEKGREQAKALGRELKREGIEVLYSSPLKRTWKTAEIISSIIGAEPLKEERVIEIDHGRWSGMLVSEVKEKFPDEFKTWMEEPHKSVFEGGESLRDVYERVGNFIDEVRVKHRGKTVGVVSHTVPIRCMLCYILGVDLSKFWYFGCDNASYSVVYFEESRNVLQRLNITCHLGDLYVEAHEAL